MPRNRIAVVIHSSLEGDGKSRNFRALGFVDELLEAGDDVALVYDGAGSKALSAILATDPASGDMFARALAKARPALRGVCEACAKAYKVYDPLLAAEVPMLGHHRRHASLRDLLEEGRQIVTF